MKTIQYSLRQMVDLTGVTEFTLRGWELRYGAFQPSRTDTGRRRYTPRDLQKALLLRELLNRDYRIGEIADLKVSHLQKIMKSQEMHSDSDVKKQYPGIHKVMKSVALQEWNTLENQLAQEFKRKKPLVIIREFVIPLFEQISFEVAAGRLSIAQEHILSALLKQHLHSLIQTNRQISKSKIIIASPEGDFHELGILTAHAMANRLKVFSLFVGPNTPKDQLCETASRFGATHILLGSTVTKDEGAKEDFYTYVHFLDQNLPKNIAFWFGGRAVQALALKRESLQLSDLADLEAHLRTIGNQGAGGR